MCQLFAVSLCVDGIEVADEERVRQRIHQQHLCMEAMINFEAKEGFTRRLFFILSRLISVNFFKLISKHSLSYVQKCEFVYCLLNDFLSVSS